MELQTVALPMELVSLCEQHGLELSRLLAATATREFLPLLDCIAPKKLLGPHVRECLLRGWPLPDVNEGPVVAMAHVPVEAGDQESDVHTDDSFVPNWAA